MKLLKYLSSLTISLILVFKLNLVKSYYIKEGKNNDIQINNFAFGSCFNGFAHNKRFDAFDSILKNNPDLFVWLGDVAYLDNLDHNLLLGLVPKYDEVKLKTKFDETFNEKNYKKFREKKPIIGIWDDHDYSYNNAKGDSPYKHQVKQLFLDFLETPKNSLRRTPEEKGIYTSYSLGIGFKSVKFILLDLRYEQTSTGKDEAMMSEEQWKWLKQELTNSDETFTFITSGIQFLPDNRNIWIEKWYQSSKRRLLNLIGETKKSGVIILSGDVHFGQLMKTFCIHPKIGYHLYEATSSGLTHYAPFSSIIIDYLLPNDYLVGSTVDYYNYGMIDFNWGDSRDTSSLKITIYDIHNNLRIQKELKYNELKHNKNYKDNVQCEIDLNSKLKPLKHYIDYYTKNPKATFGYITFFMFIYAFLKSLICILYLLLWIIKLPFKMIFNNKSKIDIIKKNK